jgi:hypothetical protein
LPATLACDPGSESSLSIEPDQRVPDVSDGRLDFDHGKERAPRVPSEDVDCASFAVDREGRFDLDHPACRLQEARGSVSHGRMSLIDQPVKGLPAPPKVEAELAIQRFRDRLELGPPKTIDLASFSVADPFSR